MSSPIPISTPIAINWFFYLLGLVILIANTVVLIVLNVPLKLAHVGEKEIY